MTCACWGWMRRLGRLELLLELPDGSKRLIPAEHTSQHDDPDPGPGTGTLGRTADLLALSVLVFGSLHPEPR